MYITSSPTLLPTASPMISPPTSSPSFTGLVIAVDIIRTTTSIIDNAEITHLETLVAESYGIANEDVSSVIVYSTSGSFDITISDTISEDEAIEELTSALSTALGITEDMISLSLDSSSGELSYTVTADDYDQTHAILSQLQSDDIIQNIDANVVIDSVNPIGEIVANINVVVDADDVEVSLQRAENQIDALLDDNYRSDVSGNNF